MSYLQGEITIYSDKCEKIEESKKNIDVKTEDVTNVKKVLKIFTLLVRPRGLRTSV